MSLYEGKGEHAKRNPTPAAAYSLPLVAPVKHETHGVYTPLLKGCFVLRYGMSLVEPHCPVILYAEDLEDDVFMMKAASRSCGQPHTLHVVRDGQQAIQYLSGVPPYESRSRYPLPALVLLDTYMPVIGGLEVLEWLQGRFEFLHCRCSCSAASFAPLI
jgi:hypothetical protein